MPEIPGKIQIIHVKDGENLWEASGDIVAQHWPAFLTDEHLWIVPDERHRSAALRSLKRKLRVQAIPSSSVCTLISLAGDIANLPILDILAYRHLTPILLQQIFRETSFETFRESQNSPGFATAFWTALEDAESRGFFPDEILNDRKGKSPPAYFRQLQRLFHQKLALMGRFTAGEILRYAIKKLRNRELSHPLPSLLFIGPFLHPNPIEIAFIKALAAGVQEVYLLPSPGSFWHSELCPEENPIPENNNSSTKIYIARSRTPEAELDGIFAKIAEFTAKNEFHYRDFRIITPGINETIPLIKSAANRYRVPVKLLTTIPLCEFPEVVSLKKIWDLFDRSWGKKELLEVLRSRILQASPLEIARFIQEVMNVPDNPGDPPGTGWIKRARSQGADQVANELQILFQLDSQNCGQLDGKAFKHFISSCIQFLRKNEKDRSVNELKSAVHQHQAENAREALDRLLNDITILITTPINRSELLSIFHQTIQAYNYTPGAAVDDAVEICANTKEDHLPAEVIFYHSLHSRVPSPGRFNPFLEEENPNEYTRQKQLFHLLTRNARKQIILSCPQFDHTGNELAMSPFLSFITTDKTSDTSQIDLLPWRPVLPDHMRQIPLLNHPTKSVEKHPARIRNKNGLEFLRRQNLRWSISKLNCALQCPYQHFAADILGLKPLADTVSEGITAAILGSIAHKALEEFLKAKINKSADFDIESWIREEFERKTILFEPHLEMDREWEDLIYCLRDFIQRGWDTSSAGFAPFKEEIEMAFGLDQRLPALNLDLQVGEVILEGEIDRIDSSAEQKAIVIDYKYKKSDSEGKTGFFNEFLQGEQPQLPLYGLVVQEILNKQPVALWQIYLRSAVIRGVQTEEIELDPLKKTRGSEIRTIAPEEMQQLFQSALKKLEEAAIKVAEGEIRPNPNDYNRCGPGKCEYADLCRYRQIWQT